MKKFFSCAVFALFTFALSAQNLADLQIKKVENKGGKITFEIHNKGAAEAGASDYMVSYMGEEVTDRTDPIGANGKMRKITVDLMPTSATTTGGSGSENNILKIMIDVKNEVKEKNEKNNEWKTPNGTPAAPTAPQSVKKEKSKGSN